MRPYLSRASERGPVTTPPRVLELAANFLHVFNHSGKFPVRVQGPIVQWYVTMPRTYAPYLCPVPMPRTYAPYLCSLALPHTLGVMQAESSVRNARTYARPYTVRAR